ncbi:alpha/beta fold hydrolase [Nocardia nova]|uniref:alpha/beta fold hydrolase n=1 Tax=Nocardia nova TaxID=37330 RepID=UPI0033C6C97C
MNLFHAGEAGIGYDVIGAGPVVLFSHGFLLNRTMFAAQVDALKDRYTCITWDQRGCGRSDPAVEPYTYWDSARDALALLDFLGVEQAVWVGLSQGGFLSLRAAILAPHRVRGLALISTRSGLDSPQTVAEFRALDKEWASNGSTNVQDSLTRLLLGPGTDPRPWRMSWSQMTRQALAEPISALVTRDDLTSRLPEITCPAVVVHGDLDVAIDVRHGVELAQRLPHARALVRIPGAGHAPPLTHPVEVTETLESFLSELDP